VPITVIVLYVFASIELIAEEIEDHFGEDDNDLPLDDICGRIKTNLQRLVELLIIMKIYIIPNFLLITTKFDRK
jgi:predicted membrane chloride channel (bestrophin family)